MKNLNTQRTFLSPSLIGLCMLSLVLALAGIPTASAYAVTSAEKFAEADAVLQRIDALQTDLNKARADYETAVSEHDAATKAMNDAQDRVKAAEDRIADLQSRLSERANSMYKNGNSSFFDVLLDASSFEEFLTSWDMIERISSQDAELVEETKTVRAEAESAREEYSTQKARAAEEMQKAKDLEDQIAATQASLATEAENITAEALELKAQEEYEAEQARIAKEAAEKAEREAAAAAAANSGGGGSYSGGGTAGPSVITGSGSLAHPLPNSVVSSPFGWRSFDNAFHRGIDLAAPSGTPYYAAEAGTVITAGYNWSAGNWIIITHGNGLTTTYMHSSEMYVSVGDHVEKGQNIGAVGSTGNSTGPHLHFQIEVNGEAVNPALYI